MPLQALAKGRAHCLGQAFARQPGNLTGKPIGLGIFEAQSHRGTLYINLPVFYIA